MSSQQECFSYKGYFGSAEVSHEDHCLVGQLLYIDDLVMYEGATYDEIEQAFQQSVDDYLKFCEEVGKEPQKTYSGSFNVRIGAALHNKAARAAVRAGVSLNDYVRQAVAHSVEEGGSMTLGASSYFFPPAFGAGGLFEMPGVVGTTVIINASHGGTVVGPVSAPALVQRVPLDDVEPEVKPKLRRVK